MSAACRLKVSLILTVLNEGRTIEATLESIEAQTRLPDQVVIADGGSADGTLEKLKLWAGTRQDRLVLSRPGANISAGRNAAIGAAEGPIIAVTDAGCTLDPRWLEELVKPFESPEVGVAMGFYRPDPRSRFERIFSCLNLPDASELDPSRFMPSSRSVAFTKQVWEKAGGYPEWLAVGEDMFFNLRVVDDGALRRFAPAALAHWRLRPDLRSTLSQYFRYAEGDGTAGMYPRRHAARFATYAAALIFMVPAARRPALVALPALLVPWRLRPAYRRALQRLSRDEAALAVAALPVYEILIDLAKMAGYLSGLRRRGNRP
ncbi:MAG: glycosyltransferase [Actinomycetota bacterium]